MDVFVHSGRSTRAHSSMFTVVLHNSCKQGTMQVQHNEWAPRNENWMRKHRKGARWTRSGRARTFFFVGSRRHRVSHHVAARHLLSFWITANIRGRNM